MLERKYFSRKEVVNYFWFTVQTLEKVMLVNKIKNNYIPTWVWEDWYIYSKIYRISKEQVEEIESKFKQYE